jgi:hypothetical protein
VAEALHKRALWGVPRALREWDVIEVKECGGGGVGEGLSRGVGGGRAQVPLCGNWVRRTDRKVRRARGRCMRAV